MHRVATLPVLLGLSFQLLACASGSHNHANSAAGVEALKEEAPPEPDAPPPPEDVVERAARPFSGYRPADARKFTDEELLTFLASANAICVGERHDQVLDHYAQLQVLQGLGKRRRMRGYELGLAMEMVRISEQPTLSAYGEGQIDEEEFAELSNWKEEWGFPIQYYRPHMRFSAHHRVHLLSLGVERELTRQVARGGMGALDEADQSRLPEIDETDEEHRALFDSMMSGHPMEEGDADKYYQAQLIWDEQMAEVSANWLSQRNPGRKLVIFAGTAHCHRTAIPARIKRRTGFSVVSVLPVEGGVERPIVETPTTSEERLDAGYDYQMIFTR